MFKKRRLRNLNILKMWKVPLQMCTYHKKPLKLPSMWVVTAVCTNQSSFESEDIILKFEKLNFKFDFYIFLPEDFSISPSKAETREDFPEPTVPTIAVKEPFFTVRLISSRTVGSSLDHLKKCSLVSVRLWNFKDGGS